jgi:hypothetical protein
MFVSSRTENKGGPAGEPNNEQQIGDDTFSVFVCQVIYRPKKSRELSLYKEILTMKD